MERFSAAMPILNLGQDCLVMVDSLFFQVRDPPSRYGSVYFIIIVSSGFLLSDSMVEIFGVRWTVGCIFYILISTMVVFRS